MPNFTLDVLEVQWVKMPNFTLYTVRRTVQWVKMPNFTLYM